jgi:hypothetical protein
MLRGAVMPGPQPEKNAAGEPAAFPFNPKAKKSGATATHNGTEAEQPGAEERHAGRFRRVNYDGIDHAVGAVRVDRNRQ